MTWGHVWAAIAGGVITLVVLIFWEAIADYRDLSSYMKDEDKGR